MVILNFDIVSSPQAGSSMQIIKTLLNLSRETEAIYAAILKQGEDCLTIDQSVGLDTSSGQSFRLCSGEPFYDMLLQQRKTVLLNVPLRVFGHLANKLSVTDEKYLQSAFFLPIVYQDNSGYLFFGLKSADTSISSICSQLSQFCKK